MSTWQMECLMDSLGALTGAPIGLLVIVLRDFVKFKAMLAEITRLWTRFMTMRRRL